MDEKLPYDMYMTSYINPQNAQLNYTKPQYTQPTKEIISPLTFDNKFSHGLCGCCENCSTCCFACWCFPCFVGVLFCDAKEGCCSGCCQCLSKIFCPFCNHLGILRSKIRGTYQLHGSINEDFYYANCCPCCTAIQLKQELMNQGEI